MLIVRLTLLIVVSLTLNGCFLTKVVTVPMRVAGEVIGAVPVVGGAAEGVIDTTAGAVDLVPL